MDGGGDMKLIVNPHSRVTALVASLNLLNRSRRRLPRSLNSSVWRVIAVCCTAIVPFQFPNLQSIASQLRQVPYSIECEDWVNLVKVSAGNVVRQDMSGFGPGWSRNAQLFWVPPPPIDKPIRNWPNLRQGFKPPTAGTYEVILHYTAAPDFGTFRVFLDGNKVRDIDGYAPKVSPQTQSLGQHQLDASNHEFLITVFTKSAFAKNFSVGLDRLELRTTSSPNNAGRLMDNIHIPQPGQQRREGVGQPRIPTPQLFFAKVSGMTQKYEVKAGTQSTFNDLELHQHLIWEAVSYATQIEWLWQVSLKPFPASPGGPPPNLVAEDHISSRTFTINFGGVPPLNSPNIRRRAPIDFYIRLVPMLNGQPAGPASNTVVAHYLPGKETTQIVIPGGNQPQQNQSTGNYKVEFLSFTPAIFPNPNREGCIHVLKNPYYTGESPLMPHLHPLSTYKPKQDYCPSYPSNSYQATSFWDYPGGWLKAYKIISDFYQDVKDLAASQFAQKFCDLLGNPGNCKEDAKKLAGTAINVGLTVAGVPPSLPNLDDLAKGKVVDAAVDYSCIAIENKGGTCTPELRAALAKGYQIGLDQLLKDNEKAANEPECASRPGALPCFTHYPGTQVEPAIGAVFQPPSVSVRVTLVKPFHNWAHPQSKLNASLTLHNIIAAGTQIENYYAPIPKTQLDGQLFVPVEVPVPILAMGQSADVTLVFDRVQQFHFSTTTDVQGKPNGYTQHNGWCRLYEGGKGALILSFLPNSNGNSTQQQIQIQKTGTCTFSP
jgi:hypothetical protein